MNQHGIIYCWHQVDATVTTSIKVGAKSTHQHDGCNIYYNKRCDLTYTINVATMVATSINKRLCQHADKSQIELTMVWLGRRHLAFAVTNFVFNLGLLRHCWTLRRRLEAATDCWRGPQYDRKCSFYFNYFFHTTATNRDLREKAVYFPPWQKITGCELDDKHRHNCTSEYTCSWKTISKWAPRGLFTNVH